MVDVRIYNTDKGSCLGEDGEILEEEGEVYVSKLETLFNSVTKKIEPQYLPNVKLVSKEKGKHQSLQSVDKIPTFKCPYCNYTSQRSYINNHIYNTHKDMRKQHPEIKARYNCEHCEETFHGKGSKDHHVKSKHSSNTVCPKCLKVCVNIISLKTHMQKHLGNTFLCALCPKEFKVKQFRNQHQKRHNRQKLYECTQCKKSFSQPQHMKNHMKRIDGCYGQKLYKCTQCEKSFSSQHLKRHMKRVGGC